MRRLATLALVTSALLPPASAVAAVSERLAEQRGEARVLRVTRWVGPSFEAERWGPVKVTVLIRTIKQDGKLVSSRITKVVASYPDENPRSYQINSDAVPYLVSYTLQNQSATIDIVTNASQTSDAFRKSLAAALTRAHFVKR